MVFEPSVILDLLSDNWTAGNVDNTTPSFYFTGGDITAQTLANGDAILIYEVAMPTNRPKGLGYDGETREVVLAVDIRTQRGSDRMEKLRNEVNRIRKAKRINPYTGFQLLLHEGERAVSGYVGFWHRVITLRLKTYIEATT